MEWRTARLEERVTVCPECGTVVVDRELHEQSHAVAMTIAQLEHLLANQQHTS